MTKPHRVEEVEIIEALATAARIIHTALDGRFNLAVMSDDDDNEALTALVGIISPEGDWTAVTIADTPELWHR